MVDDDRDAAHDQAALLRARLGAVIVVPDAYQALERLREERFDVVIAEVALPGASGIDLLERLLTPIPAVILTWLMSPAVRARALRAGAHSVLTKPCPIDMLERAVRAAVAPRAAEFVTA